MNNLTPKQVAIWIREKAETVDNAEELAQIVEVFSNFFFFWCLTMVFHFSAKN